MKRSLFRFYLLFLACCILAQSARAEALARAAFLGMLFLNRSQEDTTAEACCRLSETEATLITRLTESGGFTFIDRAPVADKVSLYANPAQCSGCRPGYGSKTEPMRLAA